MKGLPVSAKRLHGRTLRIGYQPPLPGSVFPFFDRDGAVSALVITTAHSSEIYAEPWEPCLMQVPWFGSLQIGDAAHTLCPLQEESIGTLASLWHFDPWWVLDEPRYRDHWAVPTLKRTNAAVDLQKHHLKSVYYRRDLSRVCAVQVRIRGNECFRGWKPSWVREAVPSFTEGSARVKGIGQWRLDPIWDRRWRDARFGPWREPS